VVVQDAEHGDGDEAIRGHGFDEGLFVIVVDVDDSTIEERQEYAFGELGVGSFW